MTIAPETIVAAGALSFTRPKNWPVKLVALLTALTKKFPSLEPSVTKTFVPAFSHEVSPTEIRTVPPMAGMTKLADVTVTADAPVLPGTATLRGVVQHGAQGDVEGINQTG